MNLSERQRLIMTILAIVLLVGGGGAWGYYRYTVTQDLQVEIKTLEGQIEERGRKAVTVAELEKLFASEAFKKEEQALNVHLPMESATGDTDFWMMLNKIRKTSHPQVVVRRVEPIQERGGPAEGFKVPEGVRKMLYRVDVRGGFYDILEYLSELENSDRIVRVEQFELKRRSSDSAQKDVRQAVQIEASVQVMAFEYLKKSAAGAPGAP